MRRYANDQTNFTRIVPVKGIGINVKRLNKIGLKRLSFDMNKRELVLQFLNSHQSFVLN